jgi:hypothetical protein
MTLIQMRLIGLNFRTTARTGSMRIAEAGVPSQKTTVVWARPHRGQYDRVSSQLVGSAQVAGKLAHENCGLFVRGVASWMMAARMLYAYSLAASVTRTLQQQLRHRLAGDGFAGLGGKLEHFRRIERVSHLHKRSLRLRGRSQRRDDGGGAYDSGRGRAPILRVPHRRRRDPHTCQSEREPTDEIDSRCPPVNEALEAGR